ncbi:MAG: phage holin family protein [Fischerella sp.]|jgi:putative membrane protein|uniref:phage holin family protein n=1 Tax=unclassified Fischerella TaxID=494603 RepID=UPI00047CDE04|nr:MULTISPECIES: phage holin family protein [unclassified Fischerella]NWF62643.1 phage holin family protein [Fischerella sp.]
MTGFLISVVVIAISLLIISKLPTGVEVDSPWIALIAGAIIGAFNGIWSLFPNWFRTTSTVISLGLIPLIGSIIVFGLAAWIVEGFRLRWGIASAIIGAIALSIVNSILFFILRQAGLIVY